VEPKEYGMNVEADIIIDEDGVSGQSNSGGGISMDLTGIGKFFNNLFDNSKNTITIVIIIVVVVVVVTVIIIIACVCTHKKEIVQGAAMVAPMVPGGMVAAPFLSNAAKNME
jgi:ABC-type Fe3+ transport system permease subunit